MNSKMTLAVLSIVTALTSFTGCGRFDGHKHNDSGSAANLPPPNQVCAELPHAGTAWKDEDATAKTVSDLRAKNCAAQADLLEEKEQTYKKQTDLKAQFAQFSGPETCLGKNKALTDFYPGALASLQIEFDSCLDKAGNSADAGKCLDDFKSGATADLNVGDKMAGCIGTAPQPR